MKKTLDFDFTKNEFISRSGRLTEVSEINALRVWMNKILRTVLHRYPVYSGTDYGAQIEDLLIGKNFDIDFAKSELQREIEAALLKNEEITGVSGFSFTADNGILNVNFTVKTIYGETEMNI